MGNQWTRRRFAFRAGAGLLLSVLALGSPGRSQSEQWDSAGDVEEVGQGNAQYQLKRRPQVRPRSEEVQEEESGDESGGRQVQADSNFKAIMDQNEVPPPMASSMTGRIGRGAAGFYINGETELPGQQVVSIPPRETPVELPLKTFTDLRERLKQIREEIARRLAPAVVLGAAEYSGGVEHGSLALSLKLQVTLGQAERWKIVPLVGDDVVLVKAAVDGQPIPVSSQNGYHVWVTRRTGEITLTIDFLVPARGPRGSIEYDFLVARTPLTSFGCRFPVAGLEPRLDAAVQSEAKPEAGGTRLMATLRPTTRIHLVGFRELGEAEGQPAKVYVDSLNLLSVDEDAQDLFAVFRYTILYAGVKEFNILVPGDMTVVSADGEGAFGFVLEKTNSGTLIKGETAFPIRNNYEISLRLHRETPKGSEAFDVPLPRCQGVERENGWIGVEVTGKLKLEEESRDQAFAVDVRELPPEMVGSAVSPILKSYRYHTQTARVRLKASRLPEKEPASGSVDRIRAISQVSREGNVQTDLRITLRNRLRHSLNLTLPKETAVLSATLDGQPVKPSRDDQDRIVLPLKRSTGQERLRPFTLQVSLSSKISPFGWFGGRDLFLPAVDLPVSSLMWTIFVPTNNLYSAPKGDIDPQEMVGTAAWNEAPLRLQGAGFGGGGEAVGTRSFGTTGEAASGDTGAMPVRMAVEESGVRLEYSRYWIEANAPFKPIEVSFCFVRSWLRVPAWMVLMVLLAAGLLLIATRWKAVSTRVTTWGGALLSLAVLWPTYKVGGVLVVLASLFLGLIGIASRRGWFKKAPTLLVEWARTLLSRFKGRTRPEKKATVLQIVWKIGLAAGLLIFGVLILGKTLHLVWRVVLSFGGF